MNSLVKKRCLAPRMIFATLALCAFALLLPAGAMADVVVFKNGKRQAGVVTPARGDSNSIIFRQISGPVRIPMAQIKEIEYEDDATDLLAIGDSFFTAKHYQMALDAYREAEALKPGDTAIKARIERAETALGREKNLEQREAFIKIDETLTDVEDLLKGDEFQAAEKILIHLSQEETLPEQKLQILAIRKKLYRDWAFERLDKMVPEVAALYLEKYLELEPSDKIAYDALMKIWGQMPEKTAQVIAAYEVQLKLSPNDHETRKKLGDKYLAIAKTIEVEGSTKSNADERRKSQLQSRMFYQKAAKEFTTLHDSGEFKRTGVESDLIAVLKIIYNKARADRDYRSAVDAFKQLQKYDKSATDEELHKMEFWRDSITVGPLNVEGRVELALRLRSQGLEVMAQQELRRLQSQFPDNETVKKAIRFYADAQAKKMLTAWQSLRFEEASMTARQILMDYGEFPDLVESAMKVRALTEVELAKERRNQLTSRKRWEEVGDKYFQQGLYHLRAMQNTQIDQKSRVLNDKNQAIINFKRAIDYYSRAMKDSKAMDPVLRETVSDSLKQAQAFYKQLTSTSAVPGYRSSKSR